MRPNFVRLLEGFLFPEDAMKLLPEDALRLLPEETLKPEQPELSELDALKQAKARQDVSHDKLGKWIEAAIAELSEEKRAA